MTYMDLTASEVERLHQFHLEHPSDTLRVYSDRAKPSGGYYKAVEILGTPYKTDIADKDLD